MSYFEPGTADLLASCQVSGSADGIVQLWDVAGKRCLRRYSEHQGEPAPPMCYLRYHCSLPARAVSLFAYSIQSQG